jgi:hypothetical protein
MSDHVNIISDFSKPASGFWPGEAFFRIEDFKDSRWHLGASQLAFPYGMGAVL